MIGKFIRQSWLWLLLYPLISLVLFATFWLYQLPLAAFTNAFLFSITIFLVVIGTQLYQFVRKIKTIEDLSNSDRNLLTQPLDQAYLSRFDREVEEMMDQRQQLLEESKQLKDLIKMWSHQIKVPLASLDLMVQTDQLDSQQVSKQLHSVQHYLSLLLNYMKFQDKTDDFRFEKVSVRSIITRIIKDYRIQCLVKDLSVQLQGDWELSSDPKWLSFALSQVIDNAIKYSKPGGKIIIKIAEGALQIKDQGMGILAEDLPRLFDEGFTGFNGHRYHKSTGLGLFMTKKILDELHLSIFLDSQIEQGTTVSIESQKKAYL